MMRRMHRFESPVGAHTEPPASLASPFLSQPSPTSDEWRSVAVGPGRPGARPLWRGARGDTMSGYPIQLAKVQRPVLREETLARDRLLDWLHVKIHNRVILVLADAGYGKTTLLADFSRRTRLRTLWYRLAEDDRDWVSLLSHLVAAGREHDQGFAPATAAMLSDMAVGGPTFEATLEVFLRELPSIATHGAVLILDDFHVVDESQDARIIARELVAQAPERLSIVFASRRTPTIPLARIRASGELAELGTDDLRFDGGEMACLFNETYGRALDADVLIEVATRTEGWAASLQLVQAALRDRSPADIRRFIGGLNGADHELYDYLAEEVVGFLPDDLQQFLMRTSILQVVIPDLAEVVTRLGSSEVARLTTAAERLTLLSRPSRSPLGPHRYHPLVREFLETRLRQAKGDIEVRRLHGCVGAAASAIDWHVSAHHYREAGDLEGVARVLTASIPEIMTEAAYALAAEFIEKLPSWIRAPSLDVVVSRMRMQHGDYDGAFTAAQAVLLARLEGNERDHALLNLLTLHINTGNAEEAIATAAALLAATKSPNLAMIAEAARVSVEAGGTAGNLDKVVAHFRMMAAHQKGVHAHHYGVTMLNLGQLSILQDHLDLALRDLESAAVALESTSASIELASAYVMRSATLAQLGRLPEADELLASALNRPDLRTEVDLLLEASEYQDSFGDHERARTLLNEADSAIGATAKHAWIRALIVARFHLRERNYAKAEAVLEEYPAPGSTSPGAEVSRLVVWAHLAAARGTEDAVFLAEEARRAAHSQRAHRWRRVCDLLIAYSGTGEELSSSVVEVGSFSRWHVTFLADLLVRRLPDLSSDALDVVRAATRDSPVTWRRVLRTNLQASSDSGQLLSARLLESIGDVTDVRRLRNLGKAMKRAPGASELGRSLARRLAPEVVVADLGRVTLRVGPALIPGSMVRRRVLALLTLLLTKPDFSCTRDQVLDGLWPDLEPSLALNSLNQTIYFLRRVFEEEFDDDLSPGYIHHESEVIWLNRDLVTSTSAACSQLIRSMAGVPTPDQVEALSTAYIGRFALDFEYEDWAHAFRDWLHASYLQIVERSVASDLNNGHYDRGIRVARRALEVDPSADSVEVSLLRLYRASGAHAAAAEQYAHYAGRLREDLDIEPPALESL